MLNFGIQGDKIQNILWRLNNLDFSKNCSIKYVFILGGTNNVDHNLPEEVKSSQVNFISDIRIYNYKIYSFQIQK